jgi:hypothetical protein
MSDPIADESTEAPSPDAEVIRRLAVTAFNEASALDRPRGA